MNRQAIFITVWLLIFWNSSCLAQNKNGFDLQDTVIPADLILPGGPAKGGIPAIDNPHFVTVGKAKFLNDDSVVLGMDYRGIAKAYPINILNWHEIVNDRFNGDPVVITFCPLCGSGMAFSASVRGKALTFGVSGLLYNSDVLLYDRQTQSLWSQLMTKAIGGSYKGKRLVSLPVLHTTWKDWKNRHPDTLVLSTDTGFRRNYNNSPYADYIDSPQIMFPVTSASRRYHPKEEVFGIEIEGRFKVYPFIELEKRPAEFTETVYGHLITIRYDRKHRSVAAFNRSGKQLPGVRTFWFAWYAFHPQAEIYVAPSN